jgi:triosephosphate isomerase (TIM)
MEEKASMIRIFVNLKRFEVPRTRGGLCPQSDPAAWIESVIEESIALRLGQMAGLSITYLLPEGLVPTAVRKLQACPPEQRAGLAIGVQGVHWQDIHPGKNFGAFTTSLPAAAAANLGSQWAIIGHSEERRAKLQVMQAFEPQLETDPDLRRRANQAVNQLVQAEVACALGAGLQVLVCVGETAEERGEPGDESSGDAFEEQQPRIQAVLKAQLLTALDGANEEALQAGNVIIGYEPVWAIGPGKTPPGKDYIAFVSSFLKQTAEEKYGLAAPVIYGGGLKEENAAMIASIPTIDGGLIGLTRFTGEIGFDAPGLKGIVEKYLG